MKHLRYIALILTLAFSWSVSSWAQTKLLPDVTSTEGREFFVAWLPNGGSDPSSTDLKLQLLVSSRKANRIRVEYANGSSQDYPVAARSTEIITIDPQTVYWDPARDEEEKPLSKGIRVYSITDEVFTLYSINQNGVQGTFSFDGAHILPVEALGTEYMVQTSDADAIATEFVIMSTKPGETNVTIQLKVNSRRGNTQQLSVSLSGPKQIYIVRSKAPVLDDPTDFIDLSGSTICSDQPIAVWSGNQYAVIPNQDGMSNDHAYDQLLPLNKWGKSFLVPMTTCNTKLNIMRIVAMQDNTNLTVKRGAATETMETLNAGQTFSQRMVQSENNPNPQNVSRYVTADKPIQVYLYSSSGGANTWYDDAGNTRVPSDPSMTIIPPLDYLTDTTIFSTYNGGDGSLEHWMNIWALTSKTNTIRLNGNAISGWKSVPGNTAYSQTSVALPQQTNIVTAPTKCFSGYAYGMNDGQAYLYPIGYDFTPKKDSLFLFDNDNQYKVHWSEWKDKAISTTESGWYLDKKLLDNDKYLLDSIFVCDSTTLKFPIKTYEAWYKAIWEIEGSIQGSSYFGPVEQYSSNVSRPEIEHKFLLLPEDQNKDPFEDFEVRGILIRKPVFCDIPEDKWERDTFNTIVRVMRQYNDTTWRAICIGDTVEFFKDTVWKVNPRPADPVVGRDYVLQVSIFNDTLDKPSQGYHQYSLGTTTITKQYISSGGCDSLSTLKLFVCSPHFAHKDTVVCQTGTSRLDYGEFFKRFKTNNSWPIADTVLYDTLRAKGCMSTPEYQEFRKHCPHFNGCDSVLELHLNVKKQINNNYTVNQCMSQGTIYEWREKVSDRLIHTFNSDTMVKDSTYIFREFVKYVECVDCPTSGCDSVRNILRLTFVSDGGQTHSFHVCQGDSYTYTNMNFQTTFNSVGKLCNQPYVETGTVNVYGTDDQGRYVVMCSFQDEVTFWVDTVYKDQMTYDTICWDPLATDQTYAWDKHPRFAAIPVTRPGLFTYYDTIPTYDTHCDSICVLKLRVGEPYEKPTIQEICDDGSFTWQDTLFYGKNYKGDKTGLTKLITTSLYTSRRDMLSQYGCDSVLTLSLTIHPTFVADRKDTAICANETYTFYGTVYNTPAKPWVAGQTYDLEIHDASVHGCDSMVLHRVTVHPYYPDEREPNDTICQVLRGTAYYTWEGVDHAAWNTQQHQSINRPGTYELVDPLQTVNGCDSIIHRTLVILPAYDDSITRTMSSEDTIHWTCQNTERIYAGTVAQFDNPNNLEEIRCGGETVVIDSLTTNPVGTHFCDSVRTLTLKVGKVFRDTVYDATCANCGTFEWILISPIDGHDTTIYITDIPDAYQEKLYYNYLTTSMGYDSIYVLRLTAYPSYEEHTGGEVCQGEPYTWIDHMGNDNGVAHHLYVNGQPITIIPTHQNGIIQVVDSMKTDTIYTNPKTGEIKPMHCDSVWILSLDVHPTYEKDYVHLEGHVSMASNDTASYFSTADKTLFVGYDFDYDAAGITLTDLQSRYPRVVEINRSEGTSHEDSIVSSSIFGCDSVHYVLINICEVKYTQLFDSIGDNNTTWTFAGHNAEIFHYDDNGLPIDYSQATGRMVREYLFVDTLHTANGCDSIIHDSVRVFPTYAFPFDTAVCSNTQYSWRGLTNLNRLSTGVYYDSIGYTAGTHTFDSVYVLNLTIWPSGYWSFDTTICMNDTIHWYYQTIYYQNNGLKYVEAIYKDDASTCGDVYHLDLTFAPYYGATLVEYDTICQTMGEPYQWISPGETNEHTEALRDEHGLPLSFIPADTPGDFIFYDSLKTKSCGCDSTYTLYLHIAPSYQYRTDTALCIWDEFKWIVKDKDGNDYTNGITYSSATSTHIYDTIPGTTMQGCDSSYYLHVFIDQPYEIPVEVVKCAGDEFEWNGINYNAEIADSRNWTDPKEYYDTLRMHTEAGKCDSIMYLHLTIAPSGDSIWTDTICIGETYTLFDRQIQETGVYVVDHANYWGCPITYRLTLVAIPHTEVTLVPEPVCINEAGQDFTYTIRYTYRGEFQPISYTVTYDSIASTVGFEEQIDIALADNLVAGQEYEIYVPTPRIDQKENYPRPDHYSATIAFQNGVCLSDSLMTHPLQITMSYPNWILEQRHGDVIALLNEQYNGGYTWTEYQWYQDGERLIGQTKPYLHIPSGLTPGAWYHVELTRTGETEAFPSCELEAVSNPVNNDFAPTMGYLAVTPTCVVPGHPIIYLLSRKDGLYRVATSDGQLVTEGVFRADVTEVTLPAITGMYIVQMWSNDTPEEPYRAVKVLIREQCPSCDTSF